MYLLFADESGTHGGSHALVIGGLAVHEQDAQRLQQALDRCVAQRLNLGEVDDYELHATENPECQAAGCHRQATKPVGVRRPHAPAHHSRRRLPGAGGLRAVEPDLPIALFGVVVDKRFHSEWSVFERERFAYEVLLNKFDLMLKRIRSQERGNNQGLVIHDRRVVAERDIQDWTRGWQKAAGSIGQLRNLADVPLFGIHALRV